MRSNRFGGPSRMRADYLWQWLMEYHKAEEAAAAASEETGEMEIGTLIGAETEATETT